MNNDVDALGWLAIDETLQQVYGEQEPTHYGTAISFRLGGPDPLDGISVYRNDSGAPHWHYVSYGMSELYTKESDDPEFSGFGFEFTFRLLRSPDEEEPPVWALHFLQNLARYVFQTGNVFQAGHCMHANGPLALDTETDIHALTFIQDAQLAAIETPHGKVEFLQIIGITGDELSAMQQGGTTELLQALGEGNPLLITDLSRKSVLQDPQKGASLQQSINSPEKSKGFLRRFFS